MGSEPESIIIVGPPVLFETTTQLVAVGEDWGGAVRPVAELLGRRVEG